MIINCPIIIRRDSEKRWRECNPILSLGELGFDYDNLIIKIGDGTTRWNCLKGILEVKV